MSRRRPSRFVAALAAAFLLVSAVGACMAPRVEAAARDCCKKRCDHDAAGTLRSCCCPASQAPATAATPSLPDLKPAATSASIAPAVALAGVLAPALGTPRADAPPR